MFQLNSTPSLRAIFVALLASPLSTVNAAPGAQLDLNGRDDSKGPKPQLPSVWPPPQEISASGCGVRLNREVTIVTGNASDAATLKTIKEVIAAAGGTATVATKPSGKGSQILVGTAAENGAAAAAAKALAGQAADGLADDGYVLASGKYNGQATVVLNGVDVRGTFYAAQTLSQLFDGVHGIPGVKVRDWPLMPIRGSIEGFYGIPWSHQARLDQYVFYGKHKMNTYIYTPKGDPFLRATWREQYNQSDLDQLKELVETANANHVDFTFALSPGLDICYSSDEDFNATIAKFDQVRNIGVHSFYIALDDIPLEFHCDSDTQKWPKTDDYRWFADAHAYYLSRLQTEYVEVHDLINLETVPTNYAGSAPDPYKNEFGTKLDKKVRVQWTGEGVFSPNVTTDSVIRADDTYVTDQLFFWDNFPVNDGMTSRLFLNPLEGRDADLYKHLLGFTSNPMVQSYASMIALANYGDYTWSPTKYGVDASWTAAKMELAGKDKKVQDAVVAFVDINQSWPYRKPTNNATMLSHDIDAFWASRAAGGKKDGARPLNDRLKLIVSLPDVLPKMAMKQFATEVAPWSTCAMQWATASQHYIAMLDAIDAGDKSKADSEHTAAQEWVAKTKAKTVSSLGDDGQIKPNSITPVTGDTVFDQFAAKAEAAYKGQ